MINRSENYSLFDDKYLSSLERSENTEQRTFISNATERNWKRLYTTSDNKLQSRANKTRSTKKIIPLDRITCKTSVVRISDILEKIKQRNVEIGVALYSLCKDLFRYHRILQRDNVKNFLKEYDYLDRKDLSFCESEIFREFDVLGTIYQSYLKEGFKNIHGSYYTCELVVKKILTDVHIDSDKRFLDPACGSGAFMISLETENPENIYGVDIDEVAVMLAKANMIARFKDFDFKPNVFLADFLSDTTGYGLDSEGGFDYICTNPPWGAIVASSKVNLTITSESSALFYLKATSMLKDKGMVNMLMPSSILNVKVHEEFRKHILENFRLLEIKVFDNLFAGVTTSFAAIKSTKGIPNENILYCQNGKEVTVPISSFNLDEALRFNCITSRDKIIINKIKSKGCLNLSESHWALGIVTGDNENKLRKSPNPGDEKIYTGKEICPYVLKPPKFFIQFDRSQLQQVARDEYYRAREKLVYKFVGKKLAFAYDNTGSLFLNSANILIPRIPGISTRTTLAFLNSRLFQYLYIVLFNEIKILKGNLIQLPFPNLNSTQDSELSSLVDACLKGDSFAHDRIQHWLKNYYDLTDKEVEHIDGVINGKAK